MKRHNPPEDDLMEIDEEKENTYCRKKKVDGKLKIQKKKKNRILKNQKDKLKIKNKKMTRVMYQINSN